MDGFLETEENGTRRRHKFVIDVKNQNESSSPLLGTSKVEDDEAPSFSGSKSKSTDDFSKRFEELAKFEFPSLPGFFDEPSDDEENLGLTFPATPLDSSSDSEVDPELVNREEELDVDDLDYCIPQISHCAEQVEEYARKVLVAGWNCCHFKHLPHWLQDNHYIIRGHRPPLPSVYECFKSIFRIHNETGNIWSHLLGCVGFIGIACYFWTRPEIEIPLQEKLVFAAFFLGAIFCLGLSFAFHTLHCHSKFVGKLFSKLDYCGIALLIMGSFFPWLYYGFYCETTPKIIYLTVSCVLGCVCIIVSLWERFGEPAFRPLRAGLFAGFGLSGVIPVVHYSVAKGWIHAISRASLGWLILMGFLYILGALVYASRVPERWYPEKFDIWFHSHQLFHLLVIAAALVHYHGICEMAMHRLSHGECEDHPYEYDNPIMS